MARLPLNVGANANDGTGDTLRAAMVKINTMFTEVYTAPGISSDAILIADNTISAIRSDDDLIFNPSGTGSVTFPALRFNDNNIEGTRSNEDINIIPSGTGTVVFGALSFSGNNIKSTRSNDNINLIPAGTGSVVIGGIKFAGTSLSSDDSSIININEGLIVDGTANVSGTTTLTGAVTASSTLGVTGAATLSSTLAVTGITTLTTTNIDNLTIQDANISSSSNADINITPGGTGDVVLSSLRVNGTTLDSSDSTKVTIAEAVDVTGALVAVTSLNIAGDGATVTGIKDEDNMASDSATKLATQQSIKKYVDDSVTAQDLDFQGDSGGALNIDLDSEVMTIAGGTNITTNGFGNTISIALDASLAGLTSVGVGSLTLAGNDITSSSNADINITPGGTGTIVVSDLTIDSNINITDNEIKTTASNSPLEISASGSGQVVMAKADINSGTIDNTIIGGSTPLAGTFTTLTATTSAVIDGVTITDNTISSNASNAPLELTGNGSGGVNISGFTFPTSDGSSGQFISTNGLGVLSFATAGATLNHSDIADATTTVATSSTTVINTFAHASYRSAKYFISIKDATNSRYEILEANVTHDGTNAFISTFGSTTNYTGGLATYTADINGSNVEVKATNITADSCVFKFQRIAIDA